MGQRRSTRIARSNHHPSTGSTGSSSNRIQQSSSVPPLRKRKQPPPRRNLQSVKRKRNNDSRAVSRNVLHAPSIHENSDSDNGSSDTNSGGATDDDNNNMENEDEYQGDIDDHLLNSDRNRVQSTLDSEAVQAVGNEWDSDEDNQNNQSRIDNTGRYQAEIPQWSLSSRKNALRDESDDEGGGIHRSIHRGTRLISLRYQSPELRQVIARGEKAALKQALSNSFITINDSGYTALTTMLEKIAADLNFPHLVTTFRQDIHFAQDVARVINHHMTLRRSKIKRIAESFVGFFFGFDNTDEAPEKIQNKVNTLNLKSAYIFPVENGIKNAGKPYKHPVIIRTLRKFLFDDGARKGTIGESNSEIFSSSSSDVPEMPVGLVCLAATGVHAAISDWSTGVYKRSDFVIDIVEDIYKGHQEYLATLERMGPSKYRALLHRIYMKTRAYHPTIGHTIAQGLGDFVDFDGMEDLDGSTTARESSEASLAGSLSSTVSQEL